MTIQDLNKEIGNIDIYLLDQILKGRYQESKKILDAGCGEGRNLIWFLRNKYEVYGLDKNASAIRMLQFVAKGANPLILSEHFEVGSIENNSYADLFFDAIICSAVLHFAENEEHFYQIFDELIRILNCQGTLFIRMTSNIGAEDKIQAFKEKKTSLPDGSARFLLTRNILENLIKKYPISLLEPVKTVNVEDIRFMSNLMIKKNE